MRKASLCPRRVVETMMVLGVLSGPALSGQDVVLVSSARGTGGQTAASDPSYLAALSADGNYVVFGSSAYDLVTGVADPIFTPDVFLYDARAGSSVLVSRSATSPGTPGNGSSSYPASVSGDGRYVAFESTASDLVAGMTKADSATSRDVYLFDRVSGSMTLVSHAMGAPTTTGNFQSKNPIISRDGRFVAFESGANDLVSDDNNGKQDIFLFNRTNGNVSLVSRKVGTTDTSANGESRLGSVSANGAWIAFQSKALDLANITQDINLDWDVYLFRRFTGASTLVSHADGMPLVASGGYAIRPEISADGAWVVFEGRGTNLVSGQVDGNGVDDVFLYSRASDTTFLASHASTGAATAANAASYTPSISDDGRFVAFRSRASDVVAGQVDTNTYIGSCPDAFCDFDVFRHDHLTGDTTLVSHAAGSATTTADNGSSEVALSGDGQSVAFVTRASNVVAGQSSGGWQNVFVFHGGSGTAELVSHVPGSPETGANEGGGGPRLSQHGNVAFDSGSTDYGFTDTNAGTDVFALLPGIFADGFESGSTSAWSQAVP